MTDQDRLPKEHLEGANRSFRTFLGNVRILPYEVKQQPDDDSLHHVRIQIGRSVRVVEPYRLQVEADRPPYQFALSWRHNAALDALNETVSRVSRFCTGVSTHSNQILEEVITRIATNLTAEYL